MAKKKAKTEPEKPKTAASEPPVQSPPPSPAPVKKARRREKVQLPVLVDFMLSLSQLTIMLVGILTAVISYTSGAALWMVALRTGSAIIAIGIVFWLASFLVSQGTLEVTRLEMLQAMQEAEKTAEQAVSTIEKSA